MTRQILTSIALLAAFFTQSLAQDTIQAKFTANAVCHGDETVFTNVSKTPQRVGSCDFRWDFGDGSTSTDKFPTHTYTLDNPDVGQSFTVKLVVQSRILPHEIDSVYGTVEIYPVPNPYFRWDVINYGNSQDVVIDSQATKDPTHTYQWVFANVYQSNDITPVFKSAEVGDALDGTNKNFVLLLTSKDGCDATYQTTFNYNPLSVEDVYYQQLMMYPNPANNQISFGQVYEQISVYDVHGKWVAGAEQARTLDLNLPVGIYTVKAKADGQVSTGRLILK